jgi:hypothetical protein
MLLDDLRLLVPRQAGAGLLFDRGTRAGEEPFKRLGVRYRPAGPASLAGDPAHHLIGQGQSHASG